MKMASVKNWKDFQHYKDRSPPWIKLHRGLLDDFTFQRLPVASRALAPMLWLLAAESSDGSLCIDADQLAFRLRTEETEIVEALKPLIEKGFLIVASDPLAERKRDACPEGEGETETETERETEKRKKSAAPKKPARAAVAVELQTWLDTLEGTDAIPTDDPIFEYAEKSRIPLEFLELSWRTFVRDMRERRTRKRDWRAHYRNAVRGNWYKLWWFDSGVCKLTTCGVQEQRVAA